MDGFCLAQDQHGLASVEHGLKPDIHVHLGGRGLLGVVGAGRQDLVGEGIADPEDVDVVFGATASEGYFTGTATIALTTYTVKVPHDATPSLVADKANITVTSAKIATGTAKIHLSGVNLAGTNVTLAFASTVAGLSIDKTSVAIAGGAVDTDVTVSYQSNVDVAEANVNLTISTTGVSNIVIPVTYSSTAAVTTIADVTEGIVWDFANAGTADIESPDGNNNVPFANADGFKSGFEYDKLSGKGQYFYYKDNKCYQGSQLKFRTTVSGNIVVEFSNTGSSSRPYRYLSVNGVVTDYMSKNADKVTTAAIPVPVGDVNIVGIMGTTSGDDCEPTATENMLRIYKVTFTPSANITDAAIGKRASKRRNHEAGVLVWGGDIIDAPLTQFERVWNDPDILKSTWKRFAKKAKEWEKADV